MLYLTFILQLTYNLFKDSNDKVKLERSRLWQLDISWRKACDDGGGGNTIQGLFSCDLHFF